MSLPEPMAGSGQVSSFAGDAHRPVFVGGCPRSGTTLLRTMLDSHPDLAMPRETRFLLETWERRRAFGDLSDPDNRRRLARSVFRRTGSKAGRLGVPRRSAIAVLTAAPPTIGSLLGACFAQYAERHNKIRWGDKRPIYVLHLDAIFAMFPNAQFINLIRDPRGVVASIHKLGWFGRDTIPAVDWWGRSLRAADTWRNRLRPDAMKGAGPPLLVTVTVSGCLLRLSQLATTKEAPCGRV